jgi:hypothetical protein
LKKLKGISQVKIDEEKGEVFVEYDLQEHKEEDIERWMVEAGVLLDDSYMERLKRGWIHYTEDNELDALKAKAHSCCDVDEIEQKRKEKK